MSRCGGGFFDGGFLWILIIIFIIFVFFEN